MFRRWLPWLRSRAGASSFGLGDAFDGLLLCECADGSSRC
jgi:hypothetical protein